MRIIAYRIIYPFITGGFLYLVISIVYQRNWLKNKSSKKFAGNSKKYVSIFFLILSLTTFSYSGFLSLDAILNDYVVINGIYLRSFRGKDLITSEVFFEVNKEVISLDIFASNTQDFGFEQGNPYEITYAKRTGVLISARDIEQIQ